MTQRSDEGQRVVIALTPEENSAIGAIVDGAMHVRTRLFQQIDRGEISASQAYKLLVLDSRGVEATMRFILGDERYTAWTDGAPMDGMIDRDTFICAHGRGIETWISRFRRLLSVDLPNLLARRPRGISVAIRCLQST
jgi:hypothetical protein